MRSFTSPARLPLIAPSILSADFARMGEDCRHILDPKQGDADLLHLDVMDGHFVPNLTMGPDLCRALRRTLPDAFLDVHLMVTNPAQYVDPFADAGANHLTFHVEVTPNRKALDTLVSHIRTRGMSAGIAINPPTPIDRLWSLIKPDDGAGLDLVLVMSVNPGFSGQSFIGGVLEKTRAARTAFGDTMRVQMDGGVNLDTAPACREAGCDVIVAASAIFREPPERRAGVVAALRGSEGR